MSVVQSEEVVPPAGRRMALVRMWGPAFVASVAYVDPGNVAANLTSGARFGYQLIWVLVLSNLIAMLVQYLSAKLGLVSGASLTELLGGRMRRWPRFLYFAQAEVVAIATDLAEVIGGAIALQILFGLPLIAGGLIVGAVSLGLLSVQSRKGQRSFEHVIIGLLVIIAVGFVAGLFVSGVSWTDAAHGLVPSFAGRESVLLAASMLGATVMPHAIYLHSASVVDRHGVVSAQGRPRLLRATQTEVLVAMVIAGAVNIAMLVLAASALPGDPNADSIQGAYAGLQAHLGMGVAALFGVGLLASGLASASVGAYAGVTIMKGLLHVEIPVLAMRVITLVPALAILVSGADATWSLVVSQVVLSFGIPFALVPLVWLSGGSAMGDFVSSVWLKVVSWLAVGGVIALNVLLIWLTVA